MNTELQNTHIVKFKSSRDNQKIILLAKQPGLGRQLDDWYNDCTNQPCGPLMIDVILRTIDPLRCKTDVATFPSKLFYQAVEHASTLQLRSKQNYFKL